MPAKTFPAPYGSDYNDNVPISTPTLRANLRTPCPQCGYDLRGHTDPARCPECGQIVRVGGEIEIASQWLMARLIDLWSLAILQSVGAGMLLLCRIAFLWGQYYYTILNLLAGLCVIAATVWYFWLAPGVWLRTRRPIMGAFSTRRIRQVRVWCLIDGVLVVAPVMGALWL